MDLDLAAVESFLTLVEAKHYRRAAEQLHMTSSALTKRIQRLEQQLGVTLVERSTAGVLGLTDAGERFAQSAGDLIAHARNLQRLTHAQGGRSALTLAIPAGVGRFAPQILAGFDAISASLGAMHPGIDLKNVEVAFDRIATELLDRAVDVALSPAPSQHPRIESVRLAPIHRLGLVAASHPLARVGSASAEEFSKLPMLVNPALAAEWMSPWCLGDVRDRAHAKLVEIPATDVAAIARFLGSGAAVTVIPAVLAGQLPPYLRAIELENVPAAWFYADLRRGEYRLPLSSVIGMMQSFFAAAEGSAAATV